MRGLALGLIVALCLVGCSKGLEGSWVGKVRVGSAPISSPTPGYSLNEVTKKLETTYRRTLTLEGGGKYRETFGNDENRGSWKADAESLILRSTEFNGTAVNSALQSDKRYRIVDSGKEIVTREYAAYGLELYFVRE